MITVFPFLFTTVLLFKRLFQNRLSFLRYTVEGGALLGREAEGSFPQHCFCEDVLPLIIRALTHESLLE